MNLIKVLPDIVANKIAAGEVVERPASVVKELVENALDAGAQSIVVTVEQGGSRLVRVADNGSGMGRDDALLCLERHATSKIADVRDIENILTLGFRGEALPSIASVSRTVIETRTAEEASGSRIVVEGGVLRQVSETGRDQGTTVEVRNLFYNLPARRKFLKTEQTELQHIRAVVVEAALAHPSVTFTLEGVGREPLVLGGSGDEAELLASVLGDTVAAGLTPIAGEADGVAFEGFIGRPEVAGTGFNQYLVVNGRPVRAKSIARAIAQGYGPALPPGKYPAFVLRFTLDPHRVDVNIHPSKREIRIHREYALLDGLSRAVADVLGTGAAMPTYGGSFGGMPSFERAISPVTVYAPPPDRWVPDIPRSESAGIASAPESMVSQTGLAFTPTPQPSGVSSRTGGYASEERPSGPSFMQVANRYLVTTIKEGVLIIDQHVAHERILYDEVMANLSGKAAAGQQLLFPVTLEFSAVEYDVLMPMLPHLTTIGFGIREFGERTVLVDAIPAEIAGFEDGHILYEFIEEMRAHGRITSGYLDKLAAAVACRAAIKSGTALSPQEMQYLVDRLFATRTPFVCPHGRPVVVRLSLDELNRRFGR